MLSEILFASVKPQSRSGRPAGISCSSLFPCPYRLYLVHTGEIASKRSPPTPRELLNMADGWDQEEQSVRRLAEAGVTIENRQRKIFLGKSMVPGSYDGDFTLNGLRYLWEHKAYDQQSDAVQFLTQWGMDRLPHQRAQTNGYMLGGGLERACFFVKIKNNNDYIDLAYEIDRPFIEEIVKWCDRIRIDGWKPEPVECKWCDACGLDCFEESSLDFSQIASASEPEMVEKWVKGKQLVDIGKMMQEEADVVFLGVKNKEGKYIQKGLIGDKELLILPGLEIKKLVSHYFDVDKALVLQEYGPDGLMKVSREHERISYRHRET